MSFASDFIINGDGAYANEKIVFTDNSSIGVVVDSDSLAIDGPVNKADLTLSDYTVTKITKYQWFIGDGNYYYDSQVNHKFKEPGNIQIKLTVWSETFVYAGQSFYFTYTITKEVTVQSRFYKFLTDNFAIWDEIKNPYYDALMRSAGNFFDQIHVKISGLYDLSDINKIDPNYFEELAQTLGHESYYRKVGYNTSAGTFQSFDIIDRIKNNIATLDEVNSFRLFLSKSAELFKKKGTPQDVTNFLALFDINGQAVDLWTTNFGLTPKGTITENFAEDIFENNQLSLSWDGMKIFGNNNDLGHLIKNNNSIVIDSYYKVQKYEQDADIFSAVPVINRIHPTWDIYELIRYVKKVKYIGDDFYTPIESWLTPKEVSDLLAQIYVTDPVSSLNIEVEQKRIIFDDTITFYESVIDPSLNCSTSVQVSANFVKYLPNIFVRDIRFNNGSEIGNLITGEDINTYLVDWRSVTLSGANITVDITALPLSGYFQYYPYIQVQNFMELDHLLEQGNRMSVSFLVSNQDDVESSVASKTYTAQNFDANLIYSYGSPAPLTYNLKTPDNEVHVIFRGEKITTTEKFAVDQYYRASVNAREGTFSISKVIPNSDNTLIKQKINLTGNRDDIIFDKIIFDTDNVTPFSFGFDQIYEIKISVTGSLISAWLRRRSIDTQVAHDIGIGIGNNNFGKVYDQDPWVALVENLDLDATQENVTSYNIKNQVISTVNYEYIATAGSVGFGCRNTILKVSKFIVNNRDLDDTLYDDVNKQVRLKPKYLEWQRNREIIFSSYDNSIPFFDAPIANNFNPATKIYQLDNEQASSLQTIYFNNITVDDRLATRYTVWFDQNWLMNNYNFEGKLDPSFYNKIIIPLGSQRSVFVTENTVFDQSMYKDNLGSDSSGSLGLFIANNTPIFGKYETKPEDQFSGMTRSDSGYGFDLFTTSRMQQFRLSGSEPEFLGVYEEIAPMSNYFPEIDGKLVLNDKSVFKNTFFNPIIVDTDCGKRTIGVRFRNCKDILTIIKRYSTELQKEIYMYGSFTFHVPKYSVQYAPNKDFTESELLNDYVKYSVFLPLGILNEHIKTYTLGKQFTKEFGGMVIELDGIYVRLNQDQVSYFPSQGKVTLKKLNPFENRYNELACRHWFSSNINLSSNVYRDVEPSFTTGVSGINFFFNDAARKLLISLEDTTTYSISGDYKWWLPQSTDQQWSGVYRSRSYDIITVDLAGDLTTNLNYFGYDGNPIVSCPEQRDRAALKVFFGNKIGGFNFSFENSLIPNTQCVTAANTLKALQIRLTDGDQNTPIVPNTTYYAKITVKINYSGFDQADIDILPENERDKIKILGTTKTEVFKKAPVVKCHEFYIPFSWYDENHVPSGNVIEYANFIRGSYGHGKVPSITLVPLGLMTELLNSMDAVDKAFVLDSGIDLSTWNKYLLDNMSIDAIIEPIPSSVCQLYKNYGIFNRINLNLGSHVEIQYNKSNLDWDVIDTYRYFFDGNKENFFPLPNQINTIESWITNLRSVKLNNYILNTSLYTIALDNTLRLGDDPSFQFLTASDMIGKYMLNLYLNVFNTTQNNFTFEEFDQDFDTKNEISFVPYESTSTTPYKIVERTSSENLAFKSNDNLYNIIEVGGYKAMQVNVDNTQLQTVQGKVGAENAIKNINFNLSSMPDIQKLFIIDEDSPVFDMETMVLFDPALDKIGDYRGKKLEFVIKANSAYNSVSKEYNLSEYYFVGIGTYDFDVGLGIAKYDYTANALNKSFLVGFGDYNTKNIKSNVWYRLRVIVSKDYIRVIFHEASLPERLVINYNISPKNSDVSGINQGKYEELVYVVKGLANLDITYLDKVGTKTGADFVAGNVNVDLAASKRPAGYLAGISIINQYTYVTNIKYRIQKPKIRHFSNVSDGEDFSSFLNAIRQNFNDFEHVAFIGKTLNNTLVVQVDDILYYRNVMGQPVRYIASGVIETRIFQSFVVITTTLNSAMNVVVIAETFKDEYSVFLKDNNFNIDQIYRYLAFTQRSIDQVYVDNGQMSIVLNT